MPQLNRPLRVLCNLLRSYIYVPSEKFNSPYFFGSIKKMFDRIYFMRRISVEIMVANTKKSNLELLSTFLSLAELETTK